MIHYRLMEVVYILYTQTKCHIYIYIYVCVYQYLLNKTSLVYLFVGVTPLVDEFVSNRGFLEGGVCAAAAVGVFGSLDL